jgi:hypothetical protein
MLEALLFQRLLDLSGPEDLTQVLGSLVRLLARVAGAELAYLEAGGSEDRIRIGHSKVARDVGAIEAQISREILRSAVARRQVIVTGCASSDVRFCSHASVRRNRISAVLCMPLEPVPGAIYLQGPERFTPVARQHAELCARHVGEQLLRRDHRADRLTLHQATRWFQRRHILAALERTTWNVSEAARELGVARSYLYKLIAVLDLRRLDE